MKISSPASGVHLVDFDRVAFGNIRLTPPAILTPFRWVENEGWPGELRREDIRRQAAFSSTWDDTAASFRSSDAILDQVWELCRHSIKATTFAGVYVDGDRERIPYEADAYLNLLSQYAEDGDLQMARETFAPPAHQGLRTLSRVNSLPY